MEYFVISKIQFIDGSIEYTPVYYTTDVSIMNEINSASDLSFGVFIENNKTGLQDGTVSIGDFFIETPFVYECRCNTNCIDGMDLTEITNTEGL